MTSAMDKNITSSKSYSIDSETMKSALMKVLWNLNLCIIVKAITQHNLIKDLTANVGNEEFYVSGVYVWYKFTNGSYYFTSGSSPYITNISREDVKKKIIGTAKRLLDENTLLLDEIKHWSILGLTFWCWYNWFDLSKIFSGIWCLVVISILLTFIIIR